MDSPTSSVYFPSSSERSLSSIHTDDSYSSRSSSPSSDANADSDVDVEGDLSKGFPPLSLSALAAAEDDEAPSTYTLSNPLIPLAVKEVTTLLTNSRSNEEKVIILREYISVVEPDPSMVDDLVQVSLRDQDVQRQLLERWAEIKTANQTRSRAFLPVDFSAYSARFDAILAGAIEQGGNVGVEAGEQIIEIVETIPFLLGPRHESPYKSKKEALLLLTAIGTSILTTDEQVREGIVRKEEVGYKLSLALERLVKSFDSRERGTLKRQGVVKKVLEMIKNYKEIAQMGETEWVDLLV